MSGGTDALYVGRVTHRRLRPMRHDLGYRMFWLLLDLDTLDRRRLRLLKHNAPGVFSFHDCDHIDASPTPLRAKVDGLLEAAGVRLDGGPVSLSGPAAKP